MTQRKITAIMYIRLSADETQDLETCRKNLTPPGKKSLNDAQTVRAAMRFVNERKGKK